MSKKCFVVRIEIEALVVAEDEKAARDLSIDVLREEMYNVSEQDVDIKTAIYLPDGWSENCLVYGSKEDMYATEALRLNPEYLEEVRKLQEAQDYFTKRSEEQKAKREGSKD